MTKVQKNYADLQDLLTNLPSKLNRVSNQVDKEFLSSYRVHMLSIQTELKNLKHDVTKGEQLLNSDATVAKLEAEAKWFSGNFSFSHSLVSLPFVSLRRMWKTEIAS